MKKILAAALLLVVALTLLTGCGYSGTVYPDAKSYSAGGGEIDGEVTALDVEWSSGKVIVETYDGDCVVLSEECAKELSDEMSLHYRLKNGVLTVKFSASGVRLVSGILHKTLTVKLPAKYTLDELEVSVASAEMEVRDVSAEEVELSSASGKINFSLGGMRSLSVDTASGGVVANVTDAGKCEFESASGALDLRLRNVSECSFDTASGRVDLDVSGAIKEIEGDTASGRINLTCDTTPDRCELETASGKVGLTLPKNADFKLSLDTASGDFDCDLPIRKNGGNYICGEGKAYISIDTASGDVHIYEGN